MLNSLNGLLELFGHVSEVVLFSMVLMFALGNFVGGGMTRRLNGFARKVILYVGNVDGRKNDRPETKYKTKVEA